MFYIKDDSQSSIGSTDSAEETGSTDSAEETVFIKVEPDLNFEDNEEDNLLPNLSLQNDWNYQEKGKLLMIHTINVFLNTIELKMTQGTGINNLWRPRRILRPKDNAKPTLQSFIELRLSKSVIQNYMSLN